MLVMAFVVSMIFVFAIVMAVIFVSVIFVHDVIPVELVAVIFRSSMFLMALISTFLSGMLLVALSTFLSGMLLMAHFPAFLIPFMSAVRDFVPMVFMLSDITMIRIAPNSVRMDIFMPVHPCALPRCVIDEYHATV